MNPDIPYIERAKNGDQRAFTYLYNNYVEMIKHTINNMVKNVELTNDLTSITFTKAFQKISTYVNYMSFAMWLRKIATNTCIDYIRQMKEEERDHYLDDENSHIQVPTQQSDPETELLSEETNEKVLEALTKLRSNYRTLLEMRYLQGLSYQEISDQLNIPMGTIKSNIHKAKKRLKSFYKH